jgi:hypothetical protein
MSIRRASSLLCLGLASVLFAVGCDDSPTTIVDGPTPARPGRGFASAEMSILPSQIQPVVIVGAACPDPRFVAPFTLGLAGNGFTDQFLIQVDMQFVNRIGVTTPNLSIRREPLIERFGSTRIGALETRTFPLEFPFGCAGGPPGTLIVGVIVKDEQQRERRTTMTMPVR